MNMNNLNIAQKFSLSMGLLHAMGMQQSLVFRLEVGLIPADKLVEHIAIINMACLN